MNTEESKEGLRVTMPLYLHGELIGSMLNSKSSHIGRRMAREGVFEGCNEDNIDRLKELIGDPLAGVRLADVVGPHYNVAKIDGKRVWLTRSRVGWD